MSSILYILTIYFDTLRWRNRRRKRSLKSKTENISKIYKSLVIISLDNLSNMDKQTMAVRRQETTVDSSASRISFKDIVVTRYSVSKTVSSENEVNSFNKKLKINDIHTYLQEPKNRRSIILSRRSCSQHFSRNSADQERFSNMYVWSKRLNSEQTHVHLNLSRFESNIEY